MKPEITNILIVCGSLSWGGLEIMALDSAVQLNKLGFRIYFGCPRDSRLEHEAGKYKINTVMFGSISGGTYEKIKNLRSFLKQKKIDVIHTHLSHDLWAIVPAVKMANSNAVLLLTKHISSGIRKSDLFHKFLYERVDKIFAISNFIRNNVLETCPVQNEKVEILYNGIDINNFNRSKYSEDEIRNEFRIGTGNIVVGLIGRITPGKGHEELIRAAEIINKIYPEKVVFLIVGSADESERNLEQKLKQLVIERQLKNIIFSGYRSDIPNILAGVDILTFPSHEESFGITLLEAMAMKVPVIASRSAGVIEIIPSEEFGILVSPKNSEELAKELVSLIENAELRRKLGINGRKRIEEFFDVNKQTEKLIDYYETEIGKRKL